MSFKFRFFHTSVFEKWDSNFQTSSQVYTTSIAIRFKSLKLKFLKLELLNNLNSNFKCTTIKVFSPRLKNPKSSKHARIQIFSLKFWQQNFRQLKNKISIQDIEVQKIERSLRHNIIYNSTIENYLNL